MATIKNIQNRINRKGVTGIKAVDINKYIQSNFGDSDLTEDEIQQVINHFTISESSSDIAIPQPVSEITTVSHQSGITATKQQITDIVMYQAEELNLDLTMSDIKSLTVECLKRKNDLNSIREFIKTKLLSYLQKEEDNDNKSIESIKDELRNAYNASVNRRTKKFNDSMSEVSEHIKAVNEARQKAYEKFVQELSDHFDSLEMG